MSDEKKPAVEVSELPSDFVVSVAMMRGAMQLIRTRNGISAFCLGAMLGHEFNDLLSQRFSAVLNTNLKAWCKDKKVSVPDLSGLLEEIRDRADAQLGVTPKGRVN